MKKTETIKQATKHRYWKRFMSRYSERKEMEGKLDIVIRVTKEGMKAQLAEMV